MPSAEKALRGAGHGAPEEKIWEVLETDEGLRQALTNLGLKPMICQEKGRKEAKEIQENKRRLAAAADAAGYKVLYLRAARDGEEVEARGGSGAAGGKKTVTIKPKKTAASK